MKNHLCPSCRNPTQRVPRETLRALLTPHAARRVRDAHAHRFCPASCDVVYVDEDDGSVFLKDDMSVRVGTKETVGPRPLCYCFGHSYESIADDIATFGSTSVVQDITSRCRAGDDQCRVKNPKGSCCLGQIRAAVRALQGESGRAFDEDGTACCGASKSVSRAPNADE